MMFGYLATPYTLYPKGLEAAFALACNEAGLFADAGIPIFSPIAMCHPIAVIYGLDPTDHKIWLPFIEPFMQAASYLVVLEAEGWRDSYGIKVEMAAFEVAKKPILRMKPGILPDL